MDIIYIHSIVVCPSNDSHEHGVEVYPDSIEDDPKAINEPHNSDAVICNCGSCFEARSSGFMKPELPAL